MGIIWNVLSTVAGFFKIIRGRNEVGIEAGVVAGMPKKYMS